MVEILNCVAVSNPRKFAMLIEEAAWNKHFRVAIDPVIYRHLKGHRYHCLAVDTSFVDNKHNIRMVDYIEGVPWSIDDYLKTYEFAYAQYKAALEEGNIIIAEKYHWLFLQIAYAEHHMETQIRTHKEEWLMRKMNLK